MDSQLPPVPNFISLLSIEFYAYGLYNNCLYRAQKFVVSKSLGPIYKIPEREVFLLYQFTEFLYIVIFSINPQSCLHIAMSIFEDRISQTNI